MTPLARAAAGILALMSALSGASPATADDVAAPSGIGPPVWTLPWDDAVVVARYVAPAHRFGAGHRGVDLRAADARAVRAPADGVVAFAGRVVDRSVVTVDHGGGWVTSVEPVDPTVGAGERVSRGAVLGALGAGGHAAAGTLHVGVRHHGEYVDPLGLVRPVTWAVLLPCC